MTYHRSMMPGQQWVTVRKCNCEGGLYRRTMSGVGPIMPMDFGRSGGLLRFASRLFQSRP